MQIRDERSQRSRVLRLCLGDRLIESLVRRERERADSGSYTRASAGIPSRFHRPPPYRSPSPLLPLALILRFSFGLLPRCFRK